MFRFFLYCFISSILITLNIVSLSAGVEFFEVFPNTVDDTNLEYVILRNTTCHDIDLSNTIFEDASHKEYIFPVGTIISAHSNIQIGRPTSKIILNNTDEILYLYDPTHVLVDQFSYTSSDKGVIIQDSSLVDENCEVAIDPIVTDTGTTTNSGSENTDSGAQVTDSGALESSGSGDISSPTLENTGTTDDTSSGMVSGELSFTGVDVESTGSIDITATGISLSTPSIFPEIVPTIQSPTNAIFTGGVFDCTAQNPCRINLTFLPIFGSGYLEKDHICEIITETGTQTTCNPNTIYYLTGGDIGFRLTKKVDPNSSIEVHWKVVFHEKSESPSLVTDTGSDSQSENLSLSGAVDFPEIVPVLQNYSNVAVSGSTYVCTTSPCRLNISLESIFTGSYHMGDYSCMLTYGTGTYGCNPPQLYLEGTGTLDIKIIHKGSLEEREMMYDIIPYIEFKAVTPLGMANLSKDITPPVIVLTYDGKLKKYHEMISDYEMNCYTDTCAINLSAEGSSDPDGSMLSYLWYYGLNDIKTTRDPGERKYPRGDYQIWLRVIDAAGNVSEARYYIHVLGEREVIQDEKIKTEKKKSKKETNKKTTKKVKPPKKKKMKKMVFFDPPELSLQKSKFVLSESVYTCLSTTKKCSLNLSIDNPIPDVIYRWIYSDGTMIESENPKSHSFPIGRHNVRVIASYGTTVIWQKEIPITVKKIQKPKKPKKIKPKKAHKMGSKGDTVQEKGHKIIENSIVDYKNILFTLLALFGGLMPILVFRYMRRGSGSE